MSFTPRLDDTGILNNPKWYAQNPFYISGYGMPNCTAYSYGRFWEESNDNPNDMDNKPTGLPLGNGDQWWDSNLQSGNYPLGQEPKLGAVICFQSRSPEGVGHVAIVEEINEQTGEITCSNSAYEGQYFYITHITPVNGKYDTTNFIFQGFIYNPKVIPIPPGYIKKKRFPWVLYANKLRGE